jgi:hypothetical protein
MGRVIGGEPPVLAMVGCIALQMFRRLRHVREGRGFLTSIRTRANRTSYDYARGSRLLRKRQRQKKRGKRRGKRRGRSKGIGNGRRPGHRGRPRGRQVNRHKRQKPPRVFKYVEGSLLRPWWLTKRRRLRPGPSRRHRPQRRRTARHL